MRAHRGALASQPIRNLALSPRFNGFLTTGVGRVANDRFTGNCTYTDVTGAVDGPTLPDGTVLTRYGRMAVTTSRSKLGFNLAENPENTTPTVSKHILTTPLTDCRIAVLLRSSVAASYFIATRGADGVSAWVDALSAPATVALAANTWTEVAGVYSAPAGVKSFSFGTWATTSLANGVTLDIAYIIVTRGSRTVKYIDGFVGSDSKWIGTANASESVGYSFLATTPVTSPWIPADPRLTWAPPTLSSPRTVVVDDTSANRHISLTSGQDCIITMPNTTVSDIASVGTYESLITVSGGRHVRLIGGRITVPQPTPTTLTTAMTASSTTAVVASTAAFPSNGMLRIDGESMIYTGKTSTTFTGITRNSGFYNDTAVSSNTTHAIGANVYIAERARSGISFTGQTGIVHVEGLLVDGFVCDGIRFSGGTGTAQIQRSRVDGITNYDLAYETDGHPDGVQAYGGGFSEIRLDRVSLQLGPNGNGVINKGSDSAPSTPVGQWRFYNSEILSKTGQGRSMFANSDGASSAFDVQNSWLRYDPSQGVIFSSGTSARALFNEALYKAGQVDITPASACGIGYTTPGYLP